MTKSKKKRIDKLESRCLPASLIITSIAGEIIELDLAEIRSIQINTDDFCTPAPAQIAPPVTEPVAPEPVSQPISSLNFLVSNFGPQESQPQFPPASVDGVINQRDFLVSNLGPQESQPQFPPASVDGVINQRDFLVTNIDGSETEISNDIDFSPVPNHIPKVVRVAVGLPKPTPSNPRPIITPEMVDRALENGRDAVVYIPDPTSMRRTLLAR
jgi:hypothetical protein